MSVLIKGMEMPTSCTRCIFSGWSNLYQFRCVLQKDEPVLYDCRHDKSIAVVMDGRADKCPLVPVPPHGRLVDADRIINLLCETLEALKRFPKMDGQEMHLICAFDVLGKMVNDASTIIPADKDGE